MLGSLIRFWSKGWIDSVYVKPAFHFTYFGFEWVRPLGHMGMHLLFAVVIIAALFISLGLFYRIASTVFFLGFTYIELIDVTTYLNHYYFISLVAFLLIWLPANAHFALDAKWKWSVPRLTVPLWCIGTIRFQMAVVYVFAGLAKLNEDWLLKALPLRIWLPARSYLPLVGSYMYQPWVAYLFSWFGALYDLFIVLFLLQKKTRPYAYVVVVIFHVATAIFFPGIGMFPYVMILCSLVFFDAGFHEQLLSYLPFYTHRSKENHLNPPAPYAHKHPKWVVAAITCYVIVQLAVPLRFLLYPGRLFWTEEGYRFSWRVMLMEKTGIAYFTVKDKTTGHIQEVNNADYLTELQEKMMSTQPDLILKYAHFLADTYHKKGVAQPQVFAQVYVALNGQHSQPLIDSSVNLAAQPLQLGHYTWVLPYKKSEP